MRILQITPGTGSFYCGTCMRDNALVVALRALGHDATLQPLYLPVMVDEEDAAAGEPIYFGGVNVYLQQHSALFRALPRWLDRALDSAPVLSLAARRAGMTRPEALGELTASMLRGEDGRQRKEIDRLGDALAAGPPPDVINLSNALLLGLAAPLKARLGAPVVCTLQGEDLFVDALPEPHRAACWALLAAGAAAADALVAVSHSYAAAVAPRLQRPVASIDVVHNGIDLTGYGAAHAPPDPPVIGFFARLCEDKGLPEAFDAWLALRRRPGFEAARLHLAGALTPLDEPLVESLVARAAAAGAADALRVQPNVDRAAKIAMLQGCSVLTVPARGESFGLYLLEANAAGVPAVQPDDGAFREVLDATGGGVVYAPRGPGPLADALAAILADEPRRAALGRAGREAVTARFTTARMAADLTAIYRRLVAPTP